MKSSLPPQPSPHGGLAAATAPDGNETWQYQQADGQLERAIAIGFKSVGEFYSVLIKIKKINK
ncbi:hypothetical protein [Burkholderia ambifaria]|uniref:hypothetical protein n=1 Tax=Burkholderia ambifaria TaxID=152480 RepID=UPI00158CAA85|nr:hypothetical protein [Burkholderia ambifaria]